MPEKEEKKLVDLTDKVINAKCLLDLLVVEKDALEAGAKPEEIYTELFHARFLELMPHQNNMIAAVQEHTHRLDALDALVKHHYHDRPTGKVLTDLM